MAEVPYGHKKRRGPRASDFGRMFFASHAPIRLPVGYSTVTKVSRFFSKEKTAALKPSLTH